MLRFSLLIALFVTNGPSVAMEQALPCASVPALTVFEDPNAAGDANLGYRDADGKKVISGRYSVAFDFTRYGYAYAQGNYIDERGHIILAPYLFDNGPDYFLEGLARYVENGKVGFVDRCLNKKVPASYDWASPFQDGIALVCKGCTASNEGDHSIVSGGAWGAIDRNGSNVIPLEHVTKKSVIAAIANLNRDSD